MEHVVTDLNLFRRKMYKPINTLRETNIKSRVLPRCVCYIFCHLYTVPSTTF